VNDDPEVFFEEDDEESEHFETGTAYDVFAPSGPIGIVVDTTQAGPIVHSLKKSSPMQGLISPGDLIVALDDKDVRRMDAATLTKLMAKKSQQTERKFTLMALDDYAP
jgi:C-terminal processing protease CtpA/Prc